jgi:hypothetical protein
VKKSKKLLKEHREHIDNTVKQKRKEAKEIPSVIEEVLEDQNSGSASKNDDSVDDFFIENLSDDDSLLSHSPKKKTVKVPCGSIIVADDQLVNI